MRTALGKFFLGARGAAAVETALAVGVLITAFAGLMQIVTTVFVDDRIGRGARAVARAIALNPSADPWAALRREGGLSASATCPEWTATANTCGGWTLRIDRGVAPASLPDDLSAGVSPGGGELVLVRIERGGSLAVGLARSEPQG